MPLLPLAFDGIGFDYRQQVLINHTDNQILCSHDLKIRAGCCLTRRAAVIDSKRVAAMDRAGDSGHEFLPLITSGLGQHEQALTVYAERFTDFQHPTARDFLLPKGLNSQMRDFAAKLAIPMNLRFWFVQIIQ